MYTYNVQFVTTTQLRTKSKELVKTLKEGGSVDLIHRSQIVATIKPSPETKPFTKEGADKLEKLAKKLNLPKLSYKEREKRYRHHLVKKYGQGLS